MIVTHLQERKMLIERCQEVAAAQCIRFTFLSGDVHVCAAGRLYSDPKVWVRNKPAVAGCTTTLWLGPKPQTQNQRQSTKMHAFVGICSSMFAASHQGLLRLMCSVNFTRVSCGGLPRVARLCSSKLPDINNVLGVLHVLIAKRALL